MNTRSWAFLCPKIKEIHYRLVRDGSRVGVFSLLEDGRVSEQPKLWKAITTLPSGERVGVRGRPLPHGRYRPV